MVYIFETVDYLAREKISEKIFLFEEISILVEQL